MAVFEASNAGRPAEASALAPDGQARRITALDGLRGMMTLFVVISHFYAELPGGLGALMFGWVGVDMFFVLSGYLVGKLILERRGHANFFSVFYARRFLRTLPAYAVTVLLVFGLLSVCDAVWADADAPFPLWSYLTFTQPAFMVATGGIGAHWLAPTWTLAMEEHFYLVAPALIVFTPRRWLGPVLVGVAIAAVALRLAIYQFGFANEMAALVLLPSRADLLAVGVLSALAMTSPGFPWARFDLTLRIVPLGAFVLFLGLKLAGGHGAEVVGPLVIAVGCASYLLSIVRGAPEARTLESRVLRFFGDNSYCIYLSHLPVLGLMHGLILGARPALNTPVQWAVTLAATPICVLVGWGMTKLIEEPLTRYGRTWRWSPRQRLAPARG
jgi:peptidoglycan/LPS O-acetylase OafA/YrhL